MTLMLYRNPFESKLNRLVRLRNIHEIISFYRRGPALLPVLTEVQELRLKLIADELWLLQGREDPAIRLGRPWEAFRLDLFDTKAAVWELNLPCFATDYDRTMNQLRMQYALLSYEATARMAQSLEELDEPAFLTVVEQTVWKRF